MSKHKKNKRVLLLCLKPSKNKLETAIDFCKEKNFSVKIIYLLYDDAFKRKFNGKQILYPSEYVGNTDTNSHYRETLQWQKRLSQHTVGSENLYDFFKFDESYSTLNVWVNALYPLVQVKIRLIDTIKKILEKEKPDYVEILNSDPGYIYDEQIARKVCKGLRKVIKEKHSFKHKVRLFLKDIKKSVFESYEDFIENAKEKLRPYKKIIGKVRYKPMVGIDKYKLASGMNVDQVTDYYSNIFSDNRNTLLFVARGSGTKWAFNKKFNRWVIKDEYTENVPEQLIKQCYANGCRLVIVYKDVPPIFDNDKKRYDESWKGLVNEFCLYDLGRKFNLPKKYRKEIKDRINFLIKSSAFNQIFTYRKIDFSSQLKKYFQKNLTNIIFNYILSVKKWDSVMKIFQPQLVIGGRLDISTEINVAGSKNNIPTANIKLGVSEEMLNTFSIYKDEINHDEDHLSDYYFVWGEHQKSLIKNKFPYLNKDIFSTGRTRNDSFNEQKYTETDLVRFMKLCGNYAFDDKIVFGANISTRYGAHGRPYGAFCMSPISYRDYLRTTIQFASANNMLILVKPHPADNFLIIRRILKSLPKKNIRLISPAQNFHNDLVLRNSKIFVSSVSSMFAEAYKCNNTSINIWTEDINFLYEEDRKNLYQNLSETVICQEEYLSELTNQLDEDYRTKLHVKYSNNYKKFFGSEDGDCSAKLSEIVSLLMQIPRR